LTKEMSFFFSLLKKGNNSQRFDNEEAKRIF